MFIRVLYIVLILIIPIKLYNQVKGIVKDQDSGEPLSGVIITEKNSTNQVISDDNGEFEMMLEHTSIIEIRYVGYIYQEIEVRNQSYIELEMIVDYASFVVCYLGYYPRYSELGLNYGLKNLMTGLHLFSYTPQIVNIGLFLNTSFKWRKRSRDREYLDVSLRRYNLLKLNRSTNVFLKIGYSQIKTHIEKESRRVEKRFIQSELQHKSNTIFSGIIVQKNSQVGNHQNGIVLGIERLAFGQLRIGGGIELYRDEYHYKLYVKETIERLGVSFEIKYEQIPEIFEELDFTIYYRIDY